MKRVIKPAVSLAVLGALVWWADGSTILDQLRGASLVWLGWALAALSVVTALMAKRWQIVGRVFDIEIGLPSAIAEYYIAQLVNLVVPGGVAGDVARAVRARHGADLTRAAQSVAAERILGQGVMFGMLCTGLAAALCLPGGIAWPAATWIGVVAGAGAALAAIVLARNGTATGRFIGLTLRLFTQIRLIVLSLVVAFLLMFSLYACARATGTVVPPAGWLTLLPLILSAMLIPLSVGGWGWREGAAAALFPLIGATPSSGIATGIAYGGVMMIAALPGLYFAWRSTLALSLTSQPNRRPQ